MNLLYKIDKSASIAKVLKSHNLNIGTIGALAGRIFLFFSFFGGVWWLCRLLVPHFMG